MQSLASVLPRHPANGLLPKSTVWPVWRDSARSEVKFQPITKQQRAAIWRHARRYDRLTRSKGKHGGTLGLSGLAVVHSLLFDFLNRRTGRLDPSYAAIAARASVCIRTVASKLQQLKRLGIVNWVRRCEEDSDPEGRFILRQRTNAYHTPPPSQWPGYVANDAPDPSTDSLGYPVPPPDPIGGALQALASGDVRAALADLTVDARNPLALALARLGRTMGRF
jgi:hypothetical protein